METRENKDNENMKIFRPQYLKYTYFSSSEERKPTEFEELVRDRKILKTWTDFLFDKAVK